MIIGFLIPALLGFFEEKLKELESSPDRTCTGKPVGSSCWLALANQSECYVWNPYLQKVQAMTWTSACSDGLAEGEGTLNGNYQWNDYTIIFEATRHLQNGRKQGQWVSRLPWMGGENVWKKTYANGEEQ